MFIYNGKDKQTTSNSVYYRAPTLSTVLDISVDLPIEVDLPIGKDYHIRVDLSIEVDLQIEKDYHLIDLPIQLLYRFTTRICYLSTV
jgi:hypothetical protein